MEPQFIINSGYLDKHKMTAKEFLEMLNVDFTKAVPCDKNSCCPKCGRSNQDVQFIYYHYKDWKFFKDHEGKDADYSYARINFYLCICGCTYYSWTDASSRSCKVVKVKKKKLKKSKPK